MGRIQKLGTLLRLTRKRTCNWNGPVSVERFGLVAHDLGSKETRPPIGRSPSSGSKLAGQESTVSTFTLLVENLRP